MRGKFAWCICEMAIGDLESTKERGRVEEKRKGIEMIIIIIKKKN